jgi:two-component system alkaline phosphatase synthesis response regulator PhoP
MAPEETGRTVGKERVLVVDDEETIRELVEHHLEREGYAVRCAASGEAALKAARSERPDLVLLDLMLPGMDGLDVCKALKAGPDTSAVPVIVLTAKGEEADVVAGLEVGADDYVTKPFSPRVLLARVKAVLRRNARDDLDAETPLRAGDILIDPARREVTVKGKRVDLTKTEFDLLRFLASRPGRVFTRYQIVDAVKGADYPVTDRSVDVQAVGLRRKLGAAGKFVETVRGVGYRFKD